MTRSALIIVDVQKDFLPGGALGVPAGDATLARIADIAPRFDAVVASRDFHTPDHCSFTAQGGIWPPHCVAGTPGAELDPQIAALQPTVVDKATTQDVDAYSAFQGTGLGDSLRAQDITDVTVVGLATDYCVKATALDALAEGFTVTVDRAGVAAVNVKPGDDTRALDAMAAAGAQVI